MADSRRGPRDAGLRRWIRERRVFHVYHGRRALAVLSVGLRLVVPGIAAGIGGNTAGCPERAPPPPPPPEPVEPSHCCSFPLDLSGLDLDFCGLREAAIGAAIGAAVAALVDAALAFSLEPAPDVPAVVTARPAVGCTPARSLRRGGLTLGASVTF